MQIVIDIEDDLYKKISSDDKITVYGGMRSGKTLLATLLRAVRKGKALPKGHGNLIDADDLENTMNDYMIDKNKTLIAKYVMSAAKEMLNLSPTIIEADNKQ